MSTRSYYRPSVVFEIHNVRVRPLGLVVKTKLIYTVTRKTMCCYAQDDWNLKKCVNGQYKRNGYSSLWEAIMYKKSYTRYVFNIFKLSTILQYSFGFFAHSAWKWGFYINHFCRYYHKLYITAIETYHCGLNNRFKLDLSNIIGSAQTLACYFFTWTYTSTMGAL